MTVELDEMVAPGGNDWLDLHVPLLADFECGACGQIGRHNAGCPNHHSKEVPMDTATPCKIEGCTGEAVQRMGKYGGLCEAHRPTRSQAKSNGHAATPEEHYPDQFGTDRVNETGPGNESQLSDTEALDRIAKYLREHDDWNGGDFCELAAELVKAAGRSLEPERFAAVVVVVRDGDEAKAWDVLADNLRPFDEVVFIGEPWRVKADDGEFDTLGAFDQHPDK